ncbi:hypothetical protein BT96DRAFT_983426 [Gymnopus androsaceus JB14]|uniref:Uncharacterized protein n=1 Tax=Gymnopus androsaceus JB14 TaxID=1447944 RepID=A0A6A4IPG4_9AGAR|nr:hypothetical protein BT96DRAFT_983426 [Gymnopus androsaceus JB14]
MISNEIAESIHENSRACWQRLLCLNLAPPHYTDINIDTLNEYNHYMCMHFPFLAYCEGMWKTKAIWILDFVVLDTQGGLQKASKAGGQGEYSRKAVLRCSAAKHLRTDEHATPTPLPTPLPTPASATIELPPVDPMVIDPPPAMCPQPQSTTDSDNSIMSNEMPTNPTPIQIPSKTMANSSFFTSESELNSLFDDPPSSQTLLSLLPSRHLSHDDILIYVSTTFLINLVYTNSRSVGLAIARSIDLYAYTYVYIYADL